MMKKVGIAALLIGIVCIASSLYIKGEVKEGQKKITNAQKNVDQGTSLFSMTPLTKPFGDGLASPAQKKIDEGKKDVQYYESLSHWLMVGGIVFTLAGLGSFLFRKKKI